MALKEAGWCEQDGESRTHGATLGGKPVEVRKHQNQTKVGHCLTTLSAAPSAASRQNDHVGASERLARAHPGLSAFLGEKVERLQSIFEDERAFALSSQAVTSRDLA